MSEPSATRTRYEAQLDLCCEIESHERHKRLFDRVRGTNLLLTILLASGTGLAGVKAQPVAVVIFAGLLFIVSAWESAYDLPRRAVMHGIQRERYLDLQQRMAGLTVEQIDAERACIRKADPTEYRALLIQTQNEVLVSHGHPGEHPIKGWLGNLLARLA